MRKIMMNKIFDNDAIEYSKVLVSEYKFSVKDIAVEITIRVYKYNLPNDVFEFTQSHYIKTPTQMGAYITNPTHDTEEDSLRRAVKTIMDYYKEAVNANHEPSEDWLIKNCQ